MKRIIAVTLFGVILCALATDTAWAQAAQNNNSLDRILDLYRNNAGDWEATLAAYALQLFWLLAGIQFTWTAIRLALRNSDLGEWLAELTNQILFTGFFLLLLQNSALWARAIVNSFREAASAAAQANGVAGGISPSDIFDVGVKIGNHLVESTSLWSPGSSLGLVIAAMVIIVCFALIAAFMIMALVESYVVISASVLFMGFGGSQWTKDFATKVLIYAVSVGAKLFVLQLLVALGAQVFTQLGNDIPANNTSLFVVIGAAIVMLAITKTVPDMIQGLINGASVGSGGALAGAVTGAVTGTVSGAIGGTMAARSAGKLASEQLAEAGDTGTAPGSWAGRRAWKAGAASGNFAAAVTETIGGRFSGKAPPRGTYLGQSAGRMDSKRELLEKERKRPPDGSSSGGTAGGSSSAGSAGGASSSGTGSSGNNP